MSRRPVLLFALPALALAGGLAGTPVASASGERPVVFQTRLLGANEVASGNPAYTGDPDGRGVAVVKVKGSQICVHVTATGVDPLTAAHIHEAPAGAAGSPVLTLATPDPSSRTCVTDATLAREILADSAGYYVNVHNAAFGPGALRGQLA